jgi:hypothetical protein
MDEVWLNQNFKMAASRLFEHENYADLYLVCRMTEIVCEYWSCRYSMNADKGALTRVSENLYY